MFQFYLFALFLSRHHWSSSFCVSKESRTQRNLIQDLFMCLIFNFHSFCFSLIYRFNMFLNSIFPVKTSEQIASSLIQFNKYFYNFFFILCSIYLLNGVIYSVIWKQTYILERKRGRPNHPYVLQTILTCNKMEMRGIFFSSQQCLGGCKNDKWLMNNGK